MMAPTMKSVWATAKGATSAAAVLGTLFILAACTDARTPTELQSVLANVNPTLAPLNIQDVATVQYQGQTTKILSMVQSQGSLYVTGYPFGFARWAIDGDPETPQMIFAAADNINTFAPSGRWITDYYASGAVGVLGQLAITSGSAGASIISMANTYQPVEVARDPAANTNATTTPQDETFVWSALTFDPTGTFAYGFRGTDYVYTFRVNGGNLQPIQKEAYAANGASICCVAGATTFANQLWLAFTSKLWSYQMAGDGTLANPTEYTGLLAVNIAASNNYLYVQHQQSYGNPSGAQYPSGIYVYNQQLQNVAYLRLSPKLFAVSPNDTDLYANMDDTGLEIYRLYFTQQ